MSPSQLRGQCLLLPQRPPSLSLPVITLSPLTSVPPPLRLFSSNPAFALSRLSASRYSPILCSSGGLGDNIGGNGGGGGGGYSNNGGGSNSNGVPPEGPFVGQYLALFLLLVASAAPALAAASGDGVGWEVIGGRQKRKLAGGDAGGGSGRPDLVDVGLLLEECWSWCKDIVAQLMLPHGYPHSVSSDYMEYSLWRGVQGVASQVSGVLSTQALLYAVGLGKGAIPTAAAINWVLKDGLGYLSKILLSKYGRHFDVNPKGWRLFADLLENAAHGLEILTPLFSHLFVPIGAAAGASRSAAALIQGATRNCFYAGFAVQRNYAEIIAKAEAQGMVSKFVGIGLGIALANHVSSSTQLTLFSFAIITGIHMCCNFMSYRAIQLRTLNPYRASLVFSEYLLSGQCPSVKEVNEEEPLFTGLPIVGRRKVDLDVLSLEAKDAAAEICRRLQLGSQLSKLVCRKDDASALFHLFKEEQYLLMEHQGRFCVVLKEGASPEDMLRSMFHISYLYWLEKNMGFESSSVADECRSGGRLQVSLDYVRREFQHVKTDGMRRGWVMDGLIARPQPTRIRQDAASCTS